MLMPTRRRADVQTHEHADMPMRPTRPHVNTPTPNTPTHQRTNIPTCQHAITPTRNHANASARPLTHACPRVHPTPNSAPRAGAPVRPTHPHRYSAPSGCAYMPPLLTRPHTYVLRIPQWHDLSYIHSSPLFCNIMYFCI